MDGRLPDRTGNCQMETEERTADKTGPKMIQVSLALATRLLETVADVANDMRDEGTTAIQCTSLPLVGESFFHRLLEFLSHQAARRDPVRLTALTSLKSTLTISQSRVHSRR